MPGAGQPAGKPADLTFRSKVYPALTGAREATSDQLSLLGLTARPADKMTRQVLAGCARLIADASITTETGKKDYTALVLALQGLSPQAAKQAEEAGREAASPQLPASQEPRGPGVLFNTIDAAAIDALLLSAKLTREAGDRKERGGGIRATEDGKYFYENPEESVGDDSKIVIRLKSDSIAWFHTHPPRHSGRQDPREERLSQRDVRRSIARGLNAPSDSRVVKVFKEATKTELISYLGTPTGRIVKWPAGMTHGDGQELRGKGFLVFRK